MWIKNISVLYLPVNSKKKISNMENVTEKEKRTLGQKFLEFQRIGLVSYGKYLTEQLDYASKSESRNAYKKYVQDQIEINNKKIADVDEKLK